MRFKTTLEMLAALLIIGGYFIFVERDLLTTYDREHNRSQDQQQRGTALFTAQQLPAESINSATIQWQGDGAPVMLSKQGEDWLQTQPVSFPLNTWSVKQLIDVAAGLRYTQRFKPATAEGKDLPTLSRASLLPAKATITLETTGPNPVRQTIRLGKTTLGGRAYAMINEDPQVYIVNAALHKQVIDSKITDWRRTTIDAPTEGRAQQVTLAYADRAIQMYKVDGRWALGASYSGRVDTEAVSQLLKAIGEMYIAKFVVDQPQDLSVYGLDQPALALGIHLPVAETAPQTAETQPTTAPSDQDGQDTTINQVVSPKQSRISTLLIGATEDLNNERYFASWSPKGAAPQVVFAISKADAERFDVSVDDLRDARITPLNPNDVKEVSLDRVLGGKMDLLRSSTGWSFTQPGPGFRADNAVVSSLVGSIAQAKAQAYQTVEEVKLTDPLATIRLTAIGAVQSDVLRVYPSDESDTYAVRRNDETVIYQVPADQLRDIFESASYLRQRTVWGIDVGQVTGVTLTRLDSSPYVFERQSDDIVSTEAATKPATQPMTQPVATQPAVIGAEAWRLVGGENFESSDFDDLLATLCSLRVKRWLDTPPPSDLQPTLTVEIQVDGLAPYTLVVDAARHIGTVDPTAENSRWFELDQHTMSLLESEYRDRTLFAVGVNDIECVTVAGVDNSVTLRQDESGRYVADDGQEVDQVAAGTLFDTLAGLQVKRYLQPIHVPQPPLKFEVKTHNGRSYRLAFSQSEGQKNIATDGEQWFTLDAETITRLSICRVSPGTIQK